MPNNLVYINDFYDTYYIPELKIKNNLINGTQLNLIKINSLKELNNIEGMFLLLTVNDLYVIKNDIDIYNPDVYEIDRYFRSFFKNFKYVIILSLEEFDYGHIPFSNIYIEYQNKYLNNKEGINTLINELYQKSLLTPNSKFTSKRWHNIEKLHLCLTKIKKTYFSSKDLKNMLNVNDKWLQRYMQDVNLIYNNIGYNKKKKLWYKTKNIRN